MTIKLFPNIRLLNPALLVTPSPLMNFKPSINSSRAIPTIRRIFPFKLKYLGFSTRVNSHQHLLGVRKLSTRPFRPAASSEFDRRSSRGGEIRGSKSLIEDEGELSDWVSDLGSDPVRGNKGFPKDDVVSDFRKGRATENRGGSDGDSYSMKRRRESGSGDFRQSSSRGNRNSVNSFSRNNNNNNNSSRFNRRPNSELQDDNRENYSGRKNRGFERGNASSFVAKRNERKGNNLRKMRFSDDDDDNDVGEERGRVMNGISDLLIEEASDVEDDADDDDDSVLRNNARSSIGLDKESGEKSVARSSQGKNDSFMSESRYVFK